MSAPALGLPDREYRRTSDPRLSGETTYSSHPDLKDTPIEDAETWFTNRSSYVVSKEQHAGYAVTTSRQVIESGPLPTNTSAQKAEHRLKHNMQTEINIRLTCEIDIRKEPSGNGTTGLDKIREGHRKEIRTIQPTLDTWTA
ncbi:hypothetical protein HGM15179_015775 [Zosterops borbonicus]|uniref:Uncharacterized protein n=1 Tax=Zosterops borbonicus TaxID=364589 RepID=A0A8K1G473_9PASS|nr:hypothetical protein HGM15179_015775 [Zosterops borbonicus]